MNAEDAGQTEFDPNSGLLPLSTKKLRTALAREDLSADSKKKIRDELLRRLGPWSLARDGIMSSLQRDLLVHQRLRDLGEAINVHFDGTLATLGLVVFIAVGVLLGTLVHEGWFIIALLALGSAILTGRLGGLLAAPFLLLGFSLRRAAIKRERRMSFLGEPVFEPLDSDVLLLTQLSEDQLRKTAHDKGVAGFESLSTVELIHAIVEARAETRNGQSA